MFDSELGSAPNVWLWKVVRLFPDAIAKGFFLPFIPWGGSFFLSSGPVGSGRVGPGRAGSPSVSAADSRNASGNFYFYLEHILMFLKNFQSHLLAIFQFVIQLEIYETIENY